jgi:hypothetical protein
MNDNFFPSAIRTGRSKGNKNNLTGGKNEEVRFNLRQKGFLYFK